jgi:hypothetical protein
VFSISQWTSNSRVLKKNDIREIGRKELQSVKSALPTLGINMVLEILLVEGVYPRKKGAEKIFDR